MFHATVLPDSLHVRQAPGQKNDSIDFLNKGNRIQVVAVDGSGTWLQVQYGTNKSGWCSGKYLMPEHSAGDSPWLDFAPKEIGVREVPGNEAHERIRQYLATVDDLSKTSKSSDETAWCSCFMNWLVEQAGGYGSNSAAALSWRNWRKERPDVKKAKLGDIAVFTRRSADDQGGHVALFISFNADKSQVLALGGNQSNAVRYSWYPTNGVARGTEYQLVSVRAN